ncbi:SIGNAL PEPTIDE PEPTIDASE-LIKE 5 [Salix viminalis]|uniref:SIGNAL PEPTIDE PEPTIDASE-LIKE 5 n=1 Tax=Salix viminalis TaxID=40686 RepID=A0A9Q0NRS2_SALVM|nr:SIGNAL PEPTIDE PEPTIDASE-LIKE 5 [Salix viminalis]
MAFSSRRSRSLHTIVFCIFFLTSLSFAEEASHDGDSPKFPGCDHPYNLVKVKNWVNGAGGETLTGITARFGALLPKEEKNGVRLTALPLLCAVTVTSQQKAKVAQSGGAAALLVINDNEELAEMGCKKDSSAQDISIPVVLIPKSGGESLNRSILDGQKVDLLLYAPVRPPVDLSVIFLWMMAVGTVVCASLWSEISGPEEAGERYNELSPKVNVHSYFCLQVYTQVLGIFIPFALLFSVYVMSFQMD